MRHLLKHLSTDISLPRCLQIVGYLRRMNIFSEVELRLKFLQARNQWLDELLSDVPSDNSEYQFESIDYQFMSCGVLMNTILQKINI